MSRESADGVDPASERRVCRQTGRENGLVGTYDIWLCRQSFRELAPEIGFEKHE